jgi:tRNA threonylcarbamoyladenosine biosynthesis protein TsaE
MKRQHFFSRSPKETIDFARRFAKKLKPGSVISLEGTLGSGKTTFIKGMAVGLGLHDPNEVKSPSFVLLHVYPTRYPLYHFDLYRLETLSELHDIGLEEFINNPHAISCIEWGEKAAPFLSPAACYVRLRIIDDHSRQIEISSSRSPGRSTLEQKRKAKAKSFL